jgi:hypothetical protein
MQARLFDEIGEAGVQNKKWVFSSNTRHNYFPLIWIIHGDMAPLLSYFFFFFLAAFFFAGMICPPLRI